MHVIMIANHALAVRLTLVSMTTAAVSGSVPK